MKNLSVIAAALFIMASCTKTNLKPMDANFKQTEPAQTVVVKFFTDNHGVTLVKANGMLIGEAGDSHTDSPPVATASFKVGETVLIEVKRQNENSFQVFQSVKMPARACEYWHYVN